MSFPSKGSEGEFLQQIDLWKACSTVGLDAAHQTNAKKKGKAGPSSRQASVAAPSLSGASASATASRFFLYLESTPVDAASPDASAAYPASAPASASAASLRLTATNVASVWSSQLDLAAFRRHRESLGIAAVGWKEMLQMLRTCFNTGRLSLSQQDEERTLIVTCRYNIGSEVELEGRFTLQLVEDDPYAAAVAPASVFGSPSPIMLGASQQLLSHLLFSTISNGASAETASLAPLQAQVASLRSEVSTWRNEVTSLRSENSALVAERATWLGSSSAGSAPASASQNPHGSFDASDPTRSPQAKRKPPPKPKNMSVLNPNSKRRKVGGIKLED